MQMAVTWEQTAVYNPNDPSQRSRIVWANPGGYQDYYWNRVPDAGTLGGLGAGFSSLPSAAQIAIVTVIAGIVGFVGYAKFGDRYVKPTLKRFGLAGPHRRR